MSISFAGLASGFNSADYIKAIMAQEKLPLNRLETKKEITTAYQNVFKSIQNKLNALKDASIGLSDLGSFQLSKASTSDATKLSSVADSTAVSGEYSVIINSMAQKQVVASKSFDASAAYNSSGLPTQLTVNGQNIDTTDLDLSGKTVGEALGIIANEINGLEDGGVQASVIQTSNGQRALVLTAKEYGEANKITFDTNASWGFAEKQAAKDAHLVVNGLDVYSSTNNVKDAIPGVTLTLSNTGATTVKVEQDVDGIAAKVETFVKAYNDIINTIKENTPKSTENEDGSLSLTLQGDPMLRSLRTQLGDMANKIVGDTTGFKLFSDIGLEIDKGVTSASLMTGNITFDKAKFKEKMIENPVLVEKMFKSVAIIKDDGTTEGMNGIATIFKENLKEWTDSVNGIITSKIKGYDSEISFLNEQIQGMSDRLDMKEAALKKKYVNLEVVMSSLNNQKSWITNQLAALTNSSSSS